MKQLLSFLVVSQIFFALGLNATNPAITDADFTYQQSNLLENKVYFSFDKGDPGKVSKYTWSFEGDDQTTITTDTISYTFSSPGTYYVCLTIMDTSSNKKTVCNDVNVGKLATVSSQVINGGNLKISSTKVNDSTFTFESNIPDTANVDYYWNFDDGSTSREKIVTHGYSGYRKYLVRLTVKTPESRLVSATKLVDVRLQECRTDYDISLDGNKLSLADYSASDVDAYQIDFGDGHVATFDGNFVTTTHTYQKSGIYNVTMFTIDEATQCFNFRTQTLRIGDVACNADFSYFVDTLFKSRKGVFLAKSLGNTPDYYWVFGDGHVYHAPLVRHQFSEPGYNKISLTVKTANCVDRKEVDVLIDKQDKDIEADFIWATNPTGYLQCFDRSMGDIDEYIWRIGPDTIPVSEKNPVLNDINSNVPYNVCLTVRSGNITNTTCKEVVDVIGDPCKANFSYFVDSTSNTVKFFNMSIGVDTNSIKYYLSDGRVFSEPSPVISFSDTGFYKVKMEAQCFPASGERFDYALIDLNTRKNRLKAGFVTRKDIPLNKVSGYPVDFIGLSHGDAARMRWDFENDGVIDDSTSTSPTHTYYIDDNDDPVYEVCYYVYDPVLKVEDKYCDFVNVKTGEFVDNIDNNYSLLKEVEVYPNPAKIAGIVKYYIAETSDIQVNIYNNSGKLVRSSLEKQKAPGYNIYQINVSSYSKGEYFVVLKGNKGGTITKKLIVE